MLTIGGYGIMLGLGFYMAFLLLERELKLHKKDPELAYKILLAVIPSGIIGAKLFHIIDNWSQFLSDPLGMLISGAGLTVYGGFILGILVCLVIIKKSGENPLEILDFAAPAMALGYAIGRLGCHVSGDGCYGIETSSFLGIPYPNGIIPSTASVFPTPLFESMFSFILVIALLQIRKRELSPGLLFFIYFMLNGIARFNVEFIRRNPVMAFGLTQAQVIALGFFLTGLLGIILIHVRKNRGNA